MQDVPQEAFERAGVPQVCGFKFKYNPADSEYGVGVVTDGTIPQLTSLEEALRVGKALQATLFGTPVKQKTRLHW